MTVAATHSFPFVKMTEHHCPKKDLCEDGLQLWEMVENSYNKIFDIKEDSEKTSVAPILPNLITSTDEMTIFATTSKVNKQEKIHLVSCPTSIKNDYVHSGNVNNYTTADFGDAHCRGVRIVLNTTFTAGGLSAPIFVVVYGLTPEEMPQNNIVTVPIEGLTVGSERDIYCRKEGYITFVCGKYDIDEVEETVQPSTEVEENERPDDNNQDSQEDTYLYSKEARIAKLQNSILSYQKITG